MASVSVRSIMGWLAVVFVVLSLAFGIAFYFLNGLAGRFDAEARPAEATIISRTSERVQRQGTWKTLWRVGLTFTTEDGQEMRVVQQVSNAFYNSVRKGGTLPVRYLPDDPQQVEVEEGMTGLLALIMAVAAGATGVISLFLAVIWFRQKKLVASV